MKKMYPGDPKDIPAAGPAPVLLRLKDWQVLVPEYVRVSGVVPALPFPALFPILCLPFQALDDSFTHLSEMVPTPASRCVEGAALAPDPEVDYRDRLQLACAKLWTE
jgi:hypothetical protein